MKVQPPSRRSVVRDEPGVFEVSIPARANITGAVFMIAWLGGWAVGEVTAIAALMSGKSGGGVWFLAFWLVGWTVGGGFAIRTVLQMVGGREVLRLAEGHLCVKREVLGLGRLREYDLAHVSNLRVAPADSSPLSGSRSFPGMQPGIITFDFGASTVHVGQSIDEAEAHQIVREMKARHHFK